MDIGGQMTLASVVQAGASACGFFFIGYQIWQARRSIRAGTEHTLYDHYTEVCKLFIQKPYLRPYFYDNKTLSEIDISNPHLREEIDMMSEAVLGLIEHSVLHAKNLPGDTWKNCWMPYTFERLDKSTEMRNFYFPNRLWYTKALRCVIDSYVVQMELFDILLKQHGTDPLRVTDLSEPVFSSVMGPRVRWRQFVEQYHLGKFVASYRLGKLTGTPVAGFVLTRQRPERIWGVATYALRDATGGKPRWNLFSSDQAAVPGIPPFNSSREAYPS